MKVLFLDIDGVLNSEASADLANFNWVKAGLNIEHYHAFDFCPLATNNLRRLMEDVPDLKIVLSSCWRVGRTEAQCAELLTEKGLDGSRCVGRTGASVSCICRGVEIANWLDEHPEVTKFVIVDDDSDMAHLTPHLVQTSFRVGLTLLHTEEIRKRFES